LPLRAFENRVYEVELEDERRLIVKFYRPGRWSRETILDEHGFLADLVAAEVPAVAPLGLGTGGTLGEVEGIHHAAFPPRGSPPPRLPRQRTPRHRDRGYLARTCRRPVLGALRACPRRPPGQGPLPPAPGQPAGAARGREGLLEAYELFREFDRSTPALCEPL